MENLNNVPSTGTFGNSVQKINSNFDLIVNAINSLEYQTTRSKGILNYGTNPATAFPNAVSGDWCMILSQGNVFPATIKTYNGSTWSGSSTWNPEGVDLTGYAKTTDMNTAIANSLAQATARMGYGECTVSGTALTVSIPNFILPTSGGTIHVKMSAAGTGASTLNINSTGAKTLWYNGAAVSEQNTWEANEIISVFYDGTRFMASNSQGGGGKAEKIKYDNFTSGLASENVQEALDEVSDELTELEGEVAYGSKLSTSYGADGMTSGKILKVDGGLKNVDGYKVSDFIELPANTTSLHTSGLAPNNANTYIGLVLYNSSQSKLAIVCGSGQSIPEIIDVKNDYPTAKYIRYCSLTSASPVVGVYVPGTLKEAMDELSSEISGLDDELQYGEKISSSYGSDGMTSGKILKVDGGLKNVDGYKVSDFIELPANTTSLHTSGLIPNNANTYIGLVLYNSSQSKLATVCGSGQSIPEIIDVKNDYPSAKYIRYCSYTSPSPVVDIYVVGTLKDTVDELSVVKPLGNLINITESSYGNNYTIGRTYTNQPLWFTHQNVASEVDGILKSIWFYAPDVGTYEFAVGLLDQRNTLVNERYFSLTFETTGVHNVDVYDKEIKINKGEQVFAHFISTLKATFYNSAQTYTSLYASSATSEFIRSGTNGAISGLGWTILSIEAPFALKSDVAQLEDKIDSLEQQAGNIGYVVSQNGEKYRMSVSNGELVLLSTQYKKVIALGNSLTNHGPKESIGWYGGAWAMAATRENTGWTQQFQRILRQKESNATVTGVSVYSWERNPTTANLSDMLDSYLTNDVDCIIFRAGENAHPSDSNTWSEQIKTLLNYCLTRCPNASIILSTCMWVDATKDAAIAKVATDWGLPLIYPGTSSNKERMGDYVEGTDLQLHKITDSGVAKHVNDIGFLRFANRLAANIGYATLDEQHDVTVVDGSSIGYTCFSSWVANGIFNIKTTATTVTAVDANNNALTVTNHGDEFFTFVMPDTDVTITIS